MRGPLSRPDVELDDDAVVGVVEDTVVLDPDADAVLSRSRVGE